jgi:hypothetical protein
MPILDVPHLGSAKPSGVSQLALNGHTLIQTTPTCNVVRWDSAKPSGVSQSVWGGGRGRRDQSRVHVTITRVYLLMFGCVVHQSVTLASHKTWHRQTNRAQIYFHKCHFFIIQFGVVTCLGAGILFYII